MHQHVFKVGWLLTHNIKTTVVFYYTAFLPGVLLHEISYWLAAGILNVRARQSVQFPQLDDIKELQLGLVKLDAGAHPVKRVLIELCPLLVALGALWWIATEAINLESALSLASSAELQNLAQAAVALVRGADFWLWYYLAFTIANTMLPPIPARLRSWKPYAVLIVLLVFAAAALSSGQAHLGAIGNYLHQLLTSLSALLLLTTCINVVMVIALGALEAVIERVTGHNVTFEAGRMLTMTRHEARKHRGAQRQAHRTQKQQQPARAESSPLPLTSIYDISLPIPGAPGTEPVSRRIAAVINIAPPPHEPTTDRRGYAQAEDPAASSVAGLEGRASGKRRPPMIVTDVTPATEDKQDQRQKRPVPDSKPIRDRQDAVIEKKPDTDGVAGDKSPPDTLAPFSRPFAQDDIESDPQDEMNEEPKASSLGFARPFAVQQDSEAEERSPKGTVSNQEQQNSADSISFEDSLIGDKDDDVSVVSRPSPGKTRPVPKPAKKDAAKAQKSTTSDEFGELRYEAIDDEDNYDDEEFFTDESS